MVELCFLVFFYVHQSSVFLQNEEKQTKETLICVLGHGPLVRLTSPPPARTHTNTHSYAQAHSPQYCCLLGLLLERKRARESKGRGDERERKKRTGGRVERKMGGAMTEVIGEM